MVGQSLLEDIHDFVHAVHDELPTLIYLIIDALLVVLQHCNNSGVFVVAAGLERTSSTRDL